AAAGRRALRTPGGHAAARAADVVGRQRAVRRPTSPPQAARLQTACAHAAPPQAARRGPPSPLARPPPPILIGGMGERKTLRLVAQYADACNLFNEFGTEGIAHKLEVLRGHCDAVGRDYDAIRKTVLFLGDPLANPEDFLRDVEAYR